MCEPIVARPPEPPLRAAARGFAAAALFALLASGCASFKKKPEPPPVEPTPVVKPTPPAPPAPRPVPPTPKPPEVAPIPPPRNFGEEQARRKLELSAEESNSVGGSEVGYYLDVLLGRLKQRLGPDTTVLRQGQRIVILLPASANFPPWVGSGSVCRMRSRSIGRSARPCKPTTLPMASQTRSGSLVTRAR